MGKILLCYEMNPELYVWFIFPNLGGQLILIDEF